MRMDAAKEVVALAHVVDDAGIDVVMRDGRVLGFSRDAGAGRPSRTPCALRVALLASLDTPGELLDDIDEMRLTGSLREAGGGLYHRATADVSTWCFVTTLAPTAIAELLDGCDLDLPDDTMNARISGDPQLQVAVVSISANLATHEDQAQQAAQWCFARCLVEELTMPAVASWQVATNSSSVTSPRFT